MLTPYYHDEDAGITIYHGDAREILPLLEPESIDLVLTDPPYGVEYVTARRSRTDPLRVPIDGDENLNPLRDVLPLMNRLLRDHRHAYIFTGISRLGESTDAIGGVWKIKNILVWDKGEAGTVGDLDAGYGVNWEPLIYASK